MVCQITISSYNIIWAKGGFVIEEQFIAHAQYLDMVYTQSGTLYEKIINALRTSNIVPLPPRK